MPAGAGVGEASGKAGGRGQESFGRRRRDEGLYKAVEWGHFNVSDVADVMAVIMPRPQLIDFSIEFCVPMRPPLTRLGASTSFFDRVD